MIRRKVVERNKTYIIHIFPKTYGFRENKVKWIFAVPCNNRRTVGLILIISALEDRWTNFDTSQLEDLWTGFDQLTIVGCWVNFDQIWY
jgi:hypothetical protein